MADRIDKEKKRKRHPQDGSSKPSKRVAIESNDNVKISLHAAGKWAPVIASTPGLSVPSSIVLKAFTKARKSPPQRPGKSGDIATQELLLHSSEHPKLDYTGREEEASGSGSLVKHYVAVYDPAAGKMEVMEARKVVVRGVVRAHQATAADEVTAKDSRGQRDDLGYTFGTKKAKKALQSKMENSVGPSGLAGAAQASRLTANNQAVLDSMRELVEDMPTSRDLADEVTRNKPRPKANENEENPMKVYTVENVVGLDTMKLIPVRSWTEALKAKKEIRTSSRFVARRIEENGKNAEKLKLLRYMLLLLELYNSSRPGKAGRSLPKRDDLKKILVDMPEAVLEGVKRKFTDAGMMNKQKSDSLIMHLCALACMVDNAEVDIWDLKEDLRMETKQVALYFREIGAKIRALPEERRKKLGLEKAAAAQRKVAKLTTPLDFPKVSRGRQGR